MQMQIQMQIQMESSLSCILLGFASLYYSIIYPINDYLQLYDEFHTLI